MMKNNDYSCVPQATLDDNKDYPSVPQATLDDIKKMDQAESVKTLKDVLRHAVKLEMATIPLYLYTYYSICRRPGTESPPTNPHKRLSPCEAFPASSSLFGNQAGAAIMSVAVEEMLHMSLAMNLLASMLDNDEDLPQIYDGLTFGSNGGIVLPGLSTLQGAPKVSRPGKSVERVTGRALEIPLAKLSLDQLQHFMRIEYPGHKDSQAPTISAASPDWATIGEVYDYAKALILLGGDSDGSCRQMSDDVFKKKTSTQIGSENYSASSIDTLSSGGDSFTFVNPPVVGTYDPPTAIAASTVAKYENNDNGDHQGSHALFRISCVVDAINAINTICEQGEGANFSPDVKQDADEETHYYKFWSLCAHLDGYPKQMSTPPQVPGITRPVAVCDKIKDLGERFVYNVPTNPKASDYCDAGRALVDVGNGLFQYMLIMTETTLLVPEENQKLYFNKTMHQSMIWVMDKYYQKLMNIQDRGLQVVPTFENPFPTGTTRETAFAALQKLVADCMTKSSNLTGYHSVVYYLNAVKELPNVSPFWQEDRGVIPRDLPDFVKDPAIASITPAPSEEITAAQQKLLGNDSVPYNALPAFPGKPPENVALDMAAGEGNWVRHACMGLNSCKNQGRTLNNSCAGQGWCSTSLQYNPKIPSQPNIADHTCHVQNNCKGQGGCGLYGTEEEQNNPGGNSCQARGSCATPINAERFVTDGKKRGKSVWQLARTHFNTTVWSSLDVSKKECIKVPQNGANNPSNPALFANGPTIQWIEADGGGMTACGSSGMSGAGSCA